MKPHILLIPLVTALFLSSACVSTPNELSGNENITMENIDSYLNRSARFIDLRNYSDFSGSGHIEGFEVVPFFEYLEGTVLIRNNGWEFSSQDILDVGLLETVFGEKDRAIVLMCGSGTRARYVKSALESIGYSRVYNAGGISDYAGVHLIYGNEHTPSS